MTQVRARIASGSGDRGLEGTIGVSRRASLHRNDAGVAETIVHFNGHARG
ncbi:MAG: hypothetical protein AVDCRST_MAG87-532 [uncultured Thermomicrobiales bacterium]|uniref:Uncharacterized protein n=1 Tax=uncultured Thermomicrobiales bacterium TaxID=1645740 RepID=A0A6J4UCX7_9BACT|nr:MAG: hypothetical protein AVDCRST_MAG87-532 [uncultured Thermomicrobiales bacterium]